MLCSASAALHRDRVAFSSALTRSAHGALNSTSRFSSICPKCHIPIAKHSSHSPACDAMLCICCPSQGSRGLLLCTNTFSPRRPKQYIPLLFHMPQVSHP